MSDTGKRSIEISPVDSTEANALRIRHLRLIDDSLGVYEGARVPIDQFSPLLVSQQLKELRDSKSSYIGAYIGGNLEGYAKIGDWAVADENQFTTTNGEAIFPEKKKLAIFGLVVSSELRQILATEATQYLINEAITTVFDEDTSAVYIAFNGFKSAHREICRDRGFKFTGRISEPMRLAGQAQRLYFKPLDT